MYSEWVQLGEKRKGKQIKPVYFRKKELFRMEWVQKEINLADMMIAVAPFGGPIAMTRDPNIKGFRAMRSAQDSKNLIFIYTSSGKLIKQFLWPKNRGQLKEFGWTNSETLVCVNSDAEVFVFDIFGNLIHTFVFPNVSDKKKKEKSVVRAVVFSKGVIIVTKYNEIFMWNIGDEDAVKLPMEDGKIEDAPAGLEIIPPEINYQDQVEIMYAPEMKPTLYLINEERMEDLNLTNGPFKLIAKAPYGDYIAAYTAQNCVWVIKSDFAQNCIEFDTKATTPPDKLAWCGEDCVCLYWGPASLNRGGVSLLLLIGPNGHYQRYIFDGAIHILTEVDGLRIITNETCEFLQKVPDPTLEIFQIGSLEPAAMLYDAYCEFLEQDASSIKDIRTLKEERKLEDAVKKCLIAASNEFDPELQQKLLQAASFGKSFCKDFPHKDFMETCKKIRVLNAVRDPEIGIPLTPKQYDLLGINVLIDRLVNRNHHLLAYKICAYMKLKSEKVLVHWACSKVRSNDPDEKILESIKKKLESVNDEGVSYAVVAATAFSVGKKELAINLLDHETIAGEQVPLLLKMGEIKQALKKAIESGETDLVYLVLFYMMHNMTTEQVVLILSDANEPSFILAREALFKYCKFQNVEYLRKFYSYAHMIHECGIQAVTDYCKCPTDSNYQKILEIALKMFSYRKGEEYTATDEEIRIRKEQEKMKEELQVDCIGATVTETIYTCFLKKDDQRGMRLIKEFQVPEKRSWMIRIKAFGDSGRWEDLDKLSKSKKPPVGFYPFVEICQKHNKLDEAKKYLLKLDDVYDKVELCIDMKFFQEAIELAFYAPKSVPVEDKIELLQQVQKKTTNAQTKETINKLISQLE